MEDWNQNLIAQISRKTSWLKMLWRGKRNLKTDNLNTEVQVVMKDFADVYGTESVEKKRKTMMDAKRGMVAVSPLSFCRRFELIFLDGVLKDNWLGKGVVAAEASEYDDIVNRVDIYVDFGGSIGVVGFDLTLSKDVDVIKEKILPKNRMSFGTTNLVFYTNGIVKSEKIEVPRFVIDVGSWLLKRLRDELQISSKIARIENFDALSFTVREELLFQVYIEILWEIDLYTKKDKGDLESLKLNELRKYVLGLFAVVLDGKNRRESGKKAFRRWINLKLSQRSTIEGLFYGHEADSFGSILRALEELYTCSALP